MFGKFYRVLAVCALVTFSYAQYQGWNLFDDEAKQNTHAHGSGGGSGRVYHK